jgi:hypothetical protein
LVTPFNLDTFLLSLSQNPYFEATLQEKESLISSKDLDLTKEYSEIINLLNISDYSKAIQQCQQMLHKDNSLNYFSNINFLKAYAWNGMGNKDSTNIYCKKFLNYSGKQYPAYFHQTEEGEGKLCEERNLAIHYLSSDSIPPLTFNAIRPKYYYQSFSSGYAINKEDFRPDQKIDWSVSLFENLNSKNFYGIGINYLFRKKAAICAMLKYHSNIQIATVYVPYQLYLSENQRIGIKISTGTHFLNNSYNSSQNIVAFTTISAGYHITSPIYIGGSYTYYFNMPRECKAYLQPYSWKISINMHLIKNISAEVAIQSKELLTGFSIKDVFIGYNWSINQFYLGFNGF